MLEKVSACVGQERSEQSLLGNGVERKVASPLTARRSTMPPKFPLGQIVVTRNCLDYAQKNNINLTELVTRHASGDDGDLCKADQELNDLAIKEEGCVFSTYQTNGVKIYVVTEWDRSYTTIMLAEDY